MKRIAALVLVIVLAFSLSSTAFAAVADGTATQGGSFLLGVYNSSDKKITVIPAKDIGIYTIFTFDQIPPQDQSEFLKVSEKAYDLEDSNLRSVFYLWIPERYLQIDDFAYVRYPFTCTSKDITFTVNGKEMEVCEISENSYYAKVTEFGSVLITYN